MKPVTIVSPELPVNRFVILIPTSNKIKRFVEATVATTLCRHCFDKFANNYHLSTIKLVNRKELYFVPLHTRWSTIRFLMIANHKENLTSIFHFQWLLLDYLHVICNANNLILVLQLTKREKESRRFKELLGVF